MYNYSDNTAPKKTSMGRNRIFDPSARPVLERLYKVIDNYYLEYSHNLQIGRNDKRFLFVDQWTSAERASFTALNKPLLTYNNLISYFRKIVGQQRFNTSSLEVGSLNGTGTQDAVTLRANLIRGIEYESRAQVVYQKAFEDALSSGMGFIRIKSDYESTRSFKQKISIEMEDRPERVFFDPMAKEPTKTDGEAMGRHYDMSKSEFECAYPDIPYPESFPTLGNYYIDNFNWGTKEAITICEFYEKKWRSFTIYLLSDGTEVTKKEYKKMKQDFEEAQLMGADEIAPPEMPPQGMAPNNQAEEGAPPNAEEAVQNSQEAPQAPMEEGQAPPIAPSPIQAGMPVLPTIVKSRKTREFTIVCYKCIYGHVLEKYDVPGNQFPLVAVMGDEKIIEGKRMVSSFVTYAKDPQRFLNLTVSDLAQSIKNNRKERLMATRSNIEGFENIYENPENVYGALLYNPDDQTQAAPVVLPTPELPSTLVGLIAQSQRDLKTIVGVMLDSEDRSYGQLSGKALREMIRDGNSANLIFFDNLRRAQEQVGRTILSMAPEVYDTQRDLVIKTVEGNIKKVTVNKPIANGLENDLSGTGYDVTITAGPNFAIQKEEAFDAIQKVIAGWNEQVSPLVADIIAKNIDMEDSIELANRFKTLVPPNVILQTQGELSPQQQKQMQQQQQQQQQMQQQQQEQQQMAEQLAQGKLAVEGARAQAAQTQAQSAIADAQAKQELNQVKLTSALIDAQSRKVSASVEAEKAGLDYKAQIVQSMAKIAQAHSDVSEKHFDAVKHIHNLTQTPLTQKPDNE